MRKMVWVAFLVLGSYFIPAAYGQLGEGFAPSFYGEFKPVIGGWSEYQMTAKGNPPTKMKVAVVGKEGDAYWYETAMEGRGRGKNIVKMLVSGDPADTNNVKRMIVKEGDRPAMEIPVEMMQQAPRGREAKGNVIDKGTETIQVPAGTFRAGHLQIRGAGGVVDAWVHKEISPYGLIKSQSKETEMVLLGYGTGAKTEITEVPQKFEMPQIPERRPKRR